MRILAPSPGHVVQNQRIPVGLLKTGLGSLHKHRDILMVPSLVHSPPAALQGILVQFSLTLHGYAGTEMEPAFHGPASPEKGGLGVKHGARTQEAWIQFLILPQGSYVTLDKSVGPRAEGI